MKWYKRTSLSASCGQIFSLFFLKQAFKMEKGAKNGKCFFFFFFFGKKALAESYGNTGMAQVSHHEANFFLAVKFALNGYLTELWLKKRLFFLVGFNRGAIESNPFGNIINTGTVRARPGTRGLCS